MRAFFPKIFLFVQYLDLVTLHTSDKCFFNLNKRVHFDSYIDAPPPSSQPFSESHFGYSPLFEV